MPQSIERADVREFSRSSARAQRARQLEHFFVADAAAFPLVVIAALPVLAASWLLLSPPYLLSREMTWDLLFNLSGAWHLYGGQQPHVDFHDPLGVLGFRLTEIGFWLVGPTPRAFLVGQTIVLVVAFVSAALAVWRRVPLVPGLVFVVHAALLVLVPANPGDQSNVYSFAMSYNRWGWSLLTTACLVLFLPRRDGPSRPWLDAGLVGVLLVALFYLKITFAVAGVAALLMALAIVPHVVATRRTWLLMLAACMGLAMLPFNAAYLADIGDAARSGYVRAFVADQLRIFLANRAEYALYGSGVLLLTWLWWRGQAAWHAAALAAFTVGLGMFVLSQNAQEGGVPLGLVVVYLLYDAVRRARSMFGRTEFVVPLLAILVWPSLSAASAMATLAGYHRLADRRDTLVAVEATNLRGLAVPADAQQLELPVVPASSTIPYRLLSPTHELPQRHQLSQALYVATLLEAAALFADDRRGRPKILVLDQVNPLPFVLGYPPPRGGNLWMWQDGPVRAAADVFGDVDVVLIPKHSTYARSTLDALARYHAHLAEHFPVQEQSPSWTILSRALR